MRPELLVLLVACAGDDPPAAEPIPCEEVGWVGFTQPLLTTWCTPCHASTVPDADRRGAPPGVDFDTWEGAVEWADRIGIRAGPGGTMPPAGGLSDDDRERMARWVACGADGTPSAPDPCAVRVDHAGDATAAGEPCAEGANAVTGDLVIDSDPGTALDCVCRVDGAVRVGAAVSSLTLPRLQEVGSITIGAEHASVSLPALAVAGEFVVDGASLSELGIDALQSVAGNLVVVDSTLPVEFQPARLSSVGSSLLVRGVDGVEQIELPRLESVGLDLGIEDNPALLAVIHTSDLESVGRDLRLVGNPELVMVEDFAFVDTVGGDLEIGGGGSLRSVVAFFGLDRVDGSLEIHDEPLLEDLGGFLDLKVVRGALVLSGVGVADVEGFDSLEQVGGVNLTDNPLLADWSGGSVPEIYGDVVLARDPQLTELPLVRNATRIDGGVLLTQLANLRDTSALDGVTSLGGDLEISQTAVLAEPGLAGLTDVAGAVRLVGNLSLTGPGLYGLQGVGGDVSVQDNPILPQTDVDLWLGGLTVGGIVTTSGNGG